MLSFWLKAGKINQDFQHAGFKHLTFSAAADTITEASEDDESDIIGAVIGTISGIIVLITTIISAVFGVR